MPDGAKPWPKIAFIATRSLRTPAGAGVLR